MLTFWLLPKLWHLLPRDRGRSHAVDADKSIGKPVGAGMIFIPIFAFIAVLIVPLDWSYLAVIGAMLFAMLIGYLDDRTHGGWGEYSLGAVDLLVSIVAACAVCRFSGFDVWLPFVKQAIHIPAWLFISAGAVLIWVTINSTNATDGVDGLSGSLSAMALVFLGATLYGVVGHVDISKYLLVPHYDQGPQWALLAFAMVGCLAGYLWYNCNPSVVLMGDAGSRPIGLLTGVLVLASGNPFLVFVVATVVLVNGGTGLLKVALLRFFRIPIFRNVRYPLHDHVRKNLGWSNTQVLVRFMLLQAIGTPLMMVLLLKLR
ncbi:MAG: phospho-N-acetylmuramoyl-pentapeptide-transferase [Pseudomonadales bacterium]|nr:phospho-N-acetylmuramoyl-pentapeptide-transferase [Pseudomonadales bacterium]